MLVISASTWTSSKLRLRQLMLLNRGNKLESFTAPADERETASANGSEAPSFNVQLLGYGTFSKRSHTESSPSSTSMHLRCLQSVMAAPRHFIVSPLRTDAHRRDLTNFRQDSSEQKFAAPDGPQMSVVAVSNLAWSSHFRISSVM